MTINRLAKINQIANTATIIFRKNQFKSVWHCNSVRTGNPFQVTLEWKNGNELHGSLFTFSHKEQVEDRQGKPDNHPANWSNTPVCYQVLGCAKAMAAEKGKQLNFCDSEQDASYLALLDGQVIKIVKPNGIVQWAVAMPKTKKMNLKQRVNLMRGEVEMGID